ncbi:hypothetical protein KFL_000200180 [Klebsormidium nitens]|uniref:MYND-type domain-containing protein n=1 Tax=Klebsormidium nitens TaxID=105231 RepID=A0A1Y1HQK1_KLENI|nr:hypothetical protein KFL_000200180 [Klebsormidium nitens]|eukprot:GAQ78866.1 hypothetical protein KFL_000200180 [Klebsormidium nitens]
MDKLAPGDVVPLSSISGGNIAGGQEALARAFKSNLCRFWAQHKHGFCSMWEGLSRKEKGTFLRNCYENIPENSKDVGRHGKPLVDELLLSPEMNIQDLVSDGTGSLTCLFENWCNSDLKDDISHARAMVNSLMNRGKLPRQRPRQYTMLVDLDDEIKVGGFIECHQQMALDKFQQFEAMGVALQRDVYDLAQTRVNKLLSSLALWADLYRTKILRLDNFFVSSPCVGCANCRRPDSRNGSELRGCPGCVNRTVRLYCSKECQRAHYATHVRECKRRVEAANIGKADACQVCGDPESEEGGPLRRCGGCNNEQVKYCGTECQKAAWQAGHKKDCKRG